jgi:hypothetical protein
MTGGIEKKKKTGSTGGAKLIFIKKYIQGIGKLSLMLSRSKPYDLEAL